MKSTAMKSISAGVFLATVSAMSYAAPAWQEGTAYSGGDQVTSANGLYECKPFPYEGWCGLSAYEPGVGFAWTDAWLAADGTVEPTPTAIITATPVITAAPTATPVVTAAPTATPVVTAAPTATPVTGTYPEFVPGVTKAANGSIYEFGGSCWEAKNNPGVWESPREGWFWSEVSCGTSPTATPVVTQVPTATPVVTEVPTATPTATPVVTEVPTATPVVTEVPTATPTATPAPTATPTAPPVIPGEFCTDYTVWTPGTTAQQGEVYLDPTNPNSAYKAKFYTTKQAGDPADWEWFLNCDGTGQGEPAILSMPNPKDPVALKVAGWPNYVVAATPADAAPATAVANISNVADLSSIAGLQAGFEAAIIAAANAGNSTVLLRSDVLDSIVFDKGASLGAISVKEALNAAAGATGVSLSGVNSLENNARGWAQAHNLIMTQLAPNATFGWEMTIGEFSQNYHTGYRSVWNAASKYAADLLYNFGLYAGGNAADIVAFTKPANTPALDADKWDNALRFVKQVSDFVNTPAMLSSVPASQAGNYFLGATSAERQLRHAAAHNVFAVLFDADNSALDAKINDYMTATIPLYKEGNGSAVDASLALTSIQSLNSTLLSVEQTMNNEAFLYEVSQGKYAPSTVYKWGDFLQALSSMHNVGIAGEKLWLYDEGVDDATNSVYAKVAIAAFLSQSMKETIRYNACDENNWSINTGDPVNYPLSSSCGQLQQDYASYGENPVTGVNHPYSCPRAPKMEVTATTHAGWYGAPAPLFAAPDAVLEEAGILKNGSVGRWDFSGGWCGDIPASIDTTKQAWERDECKVYVGQKSGQFVHDGSAQKSVEGCGWWGRGVIQTTGRQNFGTLNHFLGRSHVDPSTVGTNIEGINVRPAPAAPLYANLDFCSNPQLICTSEEHPELKWIAGLFYWMNDVQGYVGNGAYADWNYLTELRAYVDGGLVGTGFVDDISGIVNRGCPDSTCPISGDVDGIEDRQDNFFLILQKLGVSFTK